MSINLRLLIRILFRLALAVVLLLWDIRAFLFYAFSLLLQIHVSMTQLAAQHRVFAGLDGIRWCALLSKSGATRDDMEAAIAHVRGMLDDPALKNLDQASAVWNGRRFPWEPAGWLGVQERGGEGGAR